jgi:hypothetical protein
MFRRSLAIVLFLAFATRFLAAEGPLTSQPAMASVQFGLPIAPPAIGPATQEALDGFAMIGILTTAIVQPEDLLGPEETAASTRFVSTESGIIDVLPTLNRIESGGSFPHINDGSIFQNRPLPGNTVPELPIQQPGYYNEYVVPTPGINGPGPMRIVTGQGGELYFTPNHYQTFVPLNH